MSIQRFAHELQPGMTVLVGGSRPVTIRDITRRDHAGVANGMVFFTDTGGQRYGLPRLRIVTTPTAEQEVQG